MIDNIVLSLTDPQEFYFRIENTNACNYIGQVDIKSVLIPEVEDQNTVFCFKNLNIIDAGEGFSSYLWTNGETTQKIQISQPGKYWIEVSSGINCTSIIQIDAILSEELEIVDIIIKDFRDENSVTVVLNSNEGTLQYSLDGGVNYITDNTFNNVRPGLYELLIIKDDCHIKTQTILVGGYPNYFTPNNDGFNDTWKMNKPEFFERSRIKIYDRFGKLLKAMNAFEGWDGKFEGKLLTPTDYWFSIILDNKVVYGHFALKL